MYRPLAGQTSAGPLETTTLQGHSKTFMDPHYGSKPAFRFLLLKLYTTVSKPLARKLDGCFIVSNRKLLHLEYAVPTRVFRLLP